MKKSEDRPSREEDMPVRIVDYDPRWPGRFEAERKRITPHLAAWLAGPIEHVGSTAVPGMEAKPIVDMVAPVRDHAEARATIPCLAGLGYIHWPDDPFRGWRHWFLTPDVRDRTHHLYLIEQGDSELVLLRTFRDLLCDDARVSFRYAELKRNLAARFTRDREAYSEGKAKFIQQVLDQAGHPPSRRRER